MNDKIIIGKFSCIYKITNVSNGKFYVGSAKNLKQRWWRHRNKLKNQTHENSYLQNSWNKYGSAGFEISVIERCTSDLLMAREQFFIDTLKPQYNLSKYADRPPDVDWSTGIWDKLKKPIERIDPTTGEVKEYDSAAAAGRDGFDQNGIGLCAQGKLATSGNFYWKYIGLDFPEKLSKIDNIFRNVVGTSIDDGVQIEICSSEQCQNLGFDYARIKECCEGRKGCRSHRGYGWKYSDKKFQEYAESNRAVPRTLAPARPVLATNILTGEIRNYACPKDTIKDGFRREYVTLCCLNSRSYKSHKGWKFQFV